MNTTSKLLVADETLDKELTGLLEAAVEEQSPSNGAKEELDEKPLTQEATRAARLAFFGEKKASDKNQPDAPEETDTPRNK